MFKNLYLRRSWLRASTSTPRPMDTGSNAATSTDSMLYTWWYNMKPYQGFGFSFTASGSRNFVESGSAWPSGPWTQDAVHLMIQHETISELRIRMSLHPDPGSLMNPNPDPSCYWIRIQSVSGFRPRLSIWQRQFFSFKNRLMSFQTLARLDPNPLTSLNPETIRIRIQNTEKYPTWSRLWMRCSQVISSCERQCKLCNCPGFNPGIHGFGSVFVWYGSGSSILGWILPTRIRI